MFCTRMAKYSSSLPYPLVRVGYLVCWPRVCLNEWTSSCRSVSSAPRFWANIGGRQFDVTVLLQVGRAWKVSTEKCTSSSLPPPHPLKKGTVSKRSSFGVLGSSFPP